MVQVSGTPHQKPSYLGRPFSSINYWSTCSLRTNVNDKNDSKWVCFRKVEVFFGIKEQSSPSSHHHESTQALTSAPVPPVRNWKILEFRGTKMLAANRTTHKKHETYHVWLFNFLRCRVHGKQTLRPASTPQPRTTVLVPHVQQKAPRAQAPSGYL